jgi:hypothetical protein
MTIQEIISLLEGALANTKPYKEGEQRTSPRPNLLKTRTLIESALFELRKIEKDCNV